MLTREHGTKLIPPGADPSWFHAFVDLLVSDEYLEGRALDELRRRHDERCDRDACRAIEGRS